MKMNIPEPARKIIDRLNEHGYEAYVVGGCVRDMILKREPGDWDITTSARPEQVKALFTRTYRHTAWHCDHYGWKRGI